MSQPEGEPAVPVVEARVVAGDEVLEHAGHHLSLGAEVLGQAVFRPQRTGRGMSFLPILDAAFDVRIDPVGAADVSLEAGTVFAEVMPKAGKVRPVAPSRGREGGGKLRNLLEMFVEQMSDGVSRRHVEAYVSPRSFLHRSP